MNTRELNIAYKVRNALNEDIHNIPASTADRLAAARKLALARKKEDTPLRVRLPQPAIAGNAGGFFGEPSFWLGRMSLAVPVLALVAGLVGLYQFEQQQRISETAEIDAAVLADELPLSAYLDHGFNAYLAKRGE
jgi:hypothetical protein